MSPGLCQLRALVKERLTAAAEEILELFERTIAEYEEEVTRLRQRNSCPQEVAGRHGPGRHGPGRHGTGRHAVQIVSLSEKGVGPSVEPPHIKEDPQLCISQDEDQLQEFLFTPVFMKTENDEDESFVLYQRPTERNREETNEGNCGEEAGCCKEERLKVYREDDQLKGVYREEDQLKGVYREDDQRKVYSEDDQLKGVYSEDDQLKGVYSEDDQLKVGNCGAESEGHTMNHSEEYCQEQSSSAKLKTAIISKPHACSECGRGFRRKAHLQKHVLIHTGLKPFKCPFCEKSFTVFYTLKRHIGTHTGEKPYRCSVCQKCFRDKTGLDYHIKTHTGEKPFSCSVCHKSFTRNTCLKAHMRLHTGERPYSCPVCRKSYPQNKTLRAHLATHTGLNRDCNRSSEVHMEDHTRTKLGLNQD